MSQQVKREFNSKVKRLGNWQAKELQNLDKLASDFTFICELYIKFHLQ